jgi:hypothetical protein
MMDEKQQELFDEFCMRMAIAETERMNRATMGRITKHDMYVARLVLEPPPDTSILMAPLQADPFVLMAIREIMLDTVNRKFNEGTDNMEAALASVAKPKTKPKTMPKKGKSKGRKLKKPSERRR